MVGRQTRAHARGDVRLIGHDPPRTPWVGDDPFNALQGFSAPRSISKLPQLLVDRFQAPKLLLQVLT